MSPSADIPRHIDEKFERMAATIKLADPADTPAVVRLLTKKRFCILQALFPFLLAAATAFAAGGDPDDSDDDDPDIDRSAFAV